MPHLGVNATYTNGNHRARAMRDVGVARTVVVTWLPPESEQAISSVPHLDLSP
ncbi:hypothetical protein [Streptomyces sp. NPDC055749]